MEKDPNFHAWSRLHRDVSAALKLGTYQEVNLGMVRPEERHTRKGPDMKNEWLKVDIGEVVTKVEKRALDLVIFIEESFGPCDFY